MSTNPDCTSDDKDAICAEPPQDYKIEKIIFHPKYNTPNPFRNDIAILQLNDSVVENGNEVIISFLSNASLIWPSNQTRATIY